MKEVSLIHFIDVLHDSVNCVQAVSSDDRSDVKSILMLGLIYFQVKTSTSSKERVTTAH